VARPRVQAGASPAVLRGAGEGGSEKQMRGGKKGQGVGMGTGWEGKVVGGGGHQQFGLRWGEKPASIPQCAILRILGEV